MPDWTYQTVFRPVLRRLPYDMAQSVAFGVMGFLGRNPVGRTVIAILGHGKPAKDLSFSGGTLNFPAPVALGCGVDSQARAVSTTALFGFGLIEVGPVRMGDVESSQPTTRVAPEWRDAGITLPPDPPGITVPALLRTLQQNRVRNGVPVIARIDLAAPPSADQFRESIECLRGSIDGISLPLSVGKHGPPEQSLLATCAATAQKWGLQVFIVATAAELSNAADWLRLIKDSDFAGVILQTEPDKPGLQGALATRPLEELAKSVRQCREAGFDRLLIAGGGIQQPADALPLMSAGADMVMVDSGLTEAGPGLPKRINTAILATQQCEHSQPVEEQCEATVPVAHRSWFWSFLLGLSLLIGGLMAIIIGTTRVVLPYDEEFLGMLREEICGLNANLLPFMSHDRVTLAGTMLALGPLYLSLAWFGDRRGMHWARVAVLASSFVGFLSFFLFLGFGYFDPFHAFISAILFQLMSLGLRSSQPHERLQCADLLNTPAWRRAMWGQLIMVIQGIAILVGGAVISTFGVTSVFVPEDLEFMQTTREALVSANPRLVPMVAHDRATFGGMLMATGITVFLASIWGWQAGRRWLWSTLLLSGTVAYSTTILIHWYVGYTSLWHLMPAYGGMGMLWLAMWLSRQWLTEKNQI